MTLEVGCGRYWTRDRIADAVRAWVARYGRQPKYNQWRTATPSTPSSTTVQDRFGSWSAGMRYAGFEPRRQGREADEWTREGALKAIYQHMFDHGRRPTSDEWHTAGKGRPTSKQVKRLFGSWNAAIVAAGYTPDRLHRSVHGYRAVMAGVTKAAA